MLVRAIEKEKSRKSLFLCQSSAPEISENVEFCAMTPLQVQNSLDKIHFIKNLIIGGAAVSEKLKNEISTTLQFSNSPTRILRDLRNERNAFSHCFEADFAYSGRIFYDFK